jgi:predicted unusual protein kinase regulating ubiquinone biosynthesis (AarF/ABC1/UbiB family)
MPTSISELIAALPEDVETAKPSAGLPALGSPASLLADISRMSFHPVPIGRLRRMAALGTLQAKIGAAYLFHWLRGWFKSADEQKRLLAETHWRTALKLLDSMNYLRGAVMKVGQTLANFPDIAPPEFVETLEQLHFDAPPMHWSLLREMVHNELGDDPENVFSRFDERAFAAASLGQVHGAQLKTGEEVAIKIQYPGIARAVESDFRNLFLFLLPSRLGKDWKSTKDQCDDLRKRIEQETDYVQEAAHLEKARSLFRDEDGIVVPRVVLQFSTARMLTMERLEGVHLREFVARNPSQTERNEVARKILRAWYRMYYAGRMMYADLHPGNFLVFDDGRLGLIDFGLIMPMDAEEWEWARRLDRPLTTGRQDDRIPAIKEWNDIRDDETDRLRLCDEYADWCWRWRRYAGEFDCGDEADFRRGIDLFAEMIRKRYSRARPNTPTIARCQFGMRAVLYLLKARIDLRPIAEEEVKAAGWDRSDYAPLQ